MGTEIDRLEIEVQAEASRAAAQLDKLISKLNQVSSTLTATNTSGLRNFAYGVKQLSSAMQSMSGVKATDFNRLTKGIEKLSTINESSLYKSANGIRNFANSLNGISSVSDDAVKIGEIAKNVSKLGNSSIQKVITTLPLLSAALKDFTTTLSTAPNVSDNLIRMTNAMANLASNGSKFSSTINGLGRAARTLSKSNNEATASTKNLSGSFSTAKVSASSLTASISKLAAAYFTLKQAIEFIGNSVKKSMDFGETINLFQTSFKKIGTESAQEIGLDWGSKAAESYATSFISEAQRFNDQIVQALSLDPNTMMNYQAVFAQMANAFGLSSRSVQNLSESFTMLGTDIASLWNMDIADSMTKLKAGLAGETEPLRSIGVDITEATLKMTALKYGIDGNISSMSYATKTQLRWLAIMDQTEVAFGDMAKTIDSPANQLRILEQQWNNLSRSLGNVFLPIITTVLPYINAVVIALRDMIDTLATAMGFELPDYTANSSYVDVTGDIETMGNASDSAAASNEKLKKSLLGIDEINILSDKSSSVVPAFNNGSSGSGKLDDAIQQKTESYMAKFNEQLDGMSNKAKTLADGIKEFFKNISDKAKPSTDALKKLWDDGLSKFLGFASQGTIDFYNYFLKPVGDWTLSKGIPDLATSLNTLLTSVNWDSLNGALGDLFDALSKATIGIGQGFVNFAKDLSTALTPAIGTTSEMLAASIKSLADTIGNVDPKTWEDAGYSIGLIATAIGGIKIVEGLPVFLLRVGQGLDSIALGLSNLAYMNPVALPALFDLLGLNKWVDDLYAKLPQWCRDLWEGFWGSLEQIMIDIFNYDYLMTITQDFIDTWDKVFNPGDDAWYEIAGNIIKGLGEGLLFAVDLIFEPINDLFASIVKNICDVFGIHSPASEMKPYGKYITQGLLDGITEGWTEKWKDFSAWLSGIPEKISKGVGSLKDWFTSKGGHIVSGVEQGWNDGWTDFKDWLGGLGSKISSGFGSIKSKFSVKGGQIISGVKQGWTDGWDDFKDWLSSIPGKISSAIGSLFNVGKDLIKGFIDGFQSLSIPLPHINIDTTTKKILGKSVALPSISVDWYATGGFPEDGLFMANHNELVGQFSNGKTAVANNLQIQAGIEEAAYRGYARAIMDFGGNSNNSGSNSNITVESNLYVDSEKFYGIYQKGKAKHERRNQTALNLG